MNIKIKEISTYEAFQLLGKPETKIIDIRPIDAYNGWCLQNESRCGHFKGAKSLPAKWIEYLDWIEIVRSKKILPQHKIVLYGYSSAESEKVAKDIKVLENAYNDNQGITAAFNKNILNVVYTDNNQWFSLIHLIA